MRTFDYIVMGAFLLALCGLGGLFTTTRRRAAAAAGAAGSETDEHLLAGGRIPWWAAGLSYVMALFSTISMVSIPGEAYNNGLRFYVLDWIGPFTGLLFFFIFVRFYFMARTYTPFEYLERRFDARVRALVSGIFLLTRITILAMVLFSCSRVFEAMAGWQVWATIVVLGVVSILYCTLGGLKAVIWTNVLQFGVWVVGTCLVVYLCATAVDGGAVGVIEYAFENGRGFNFNREFFSIDPHVRITFWLLLINSSFAYMFYASSDQIALQQLLSTSSYKEATRSFLTSVVIFIPMGFILWFLGLAVFAYFGQHPLADAAGNPQKLPGDLALFTFIASKTPQPVPGLMASAALSAAISTVGAMIMSLSTVATKDFYLRFFKPDASDQQQVACARWTTVIIGAAATATGIWISFASASLRETLIESNTIWGSIITVVPPIFFLGVMSQRTNANHVLAAAAFGIAVTGVMVGWYFYSKQPGNKPISFLAVTQPGFIGTIVFGLIAPYVAGKRPPREKLQNRTLFTLSRADEAALADAGAGNNVVHAGNRYDN